MPFTKITKGPLQGMTITHQQPMASTDIGMKFIPVADFSHTEPPDAYYMRISHGNRQSDPHGDTNADNNLRTFFNVSAAYGQAPCVKMKFVGGEPRPEIVLVLDTEQVHFLMDPV